MEKETPYLIRRSFEMLLEEEVQTVADIRNTLPFPLDDLEELADLEPGALGAPVQTRAEPGLKAGLRPSSGTVGDRFAGKVKVYAAIVWRLPSVQFPCVAS